MEVGEAVPILSGRVAGEVPLQLAYSPKLADERVLQLLMKQLIFSVGPQVLVLPQKQQRIPYFSILPGSNGLQTNNHE